MSTKTRIMTICETKMIYKYKLQWENEWKKRELLQKTKTENLGKPYSNIVPTWHDTAMQTQTGFQFFNWK